MTSLLIVLLPLTQNSTQSYDVTVDCFIAFNTEQYAEL